MKKYAMIFALMSAVLFACEPPAQQVSTAPPPEPIKEKATQIKFTNIETFEYEGCEYIALKNSEGINRGFGFMSHKGNCKNPIHIYNLPEQEASDSLEVSE